MSRCRTLDTPALANNALAEELSSLAVKRTSSGVKLAKMFFRNNASAIAEVDAISSDSQELKEIESLSTTVGIHQIAIQEYMT